MMETLNIAEREIGATLPSIEECKMSSPPSQRVVDSSKWSNTNSQSESKSECVNILSPTYSGEDIKAESGIDRSDYNGVEPRLSLNRCEDMGQRTERTTGYLMSKGQEDILINMKEEEEDDWEWQSVKIKTEDGVRDEEGLWNEEEKEMDEQREERVTDQCVRTDKLVKNVGKSEQQEEEKLSTLVASCLLKQPRVLIHRLEIDNSSVPVSSPSRLVVYKSDQGASSPWRPHEFSPLRGNQSQRQKGHPHLPSSSENGICAETSLISPVMSPRNQNTGETVEEASWVFACSQCPFIHTEEVNLHQHIEKFQFICTMMETLTVAEGEIGGVEPRSGLDGSEDAKERTERKTGYFMSREPRDILTNMKEEEENGERQSVKMETVNDVKDQRATSPWRRHELSPLRGNRARRQKMQVVTRKRKTVGQLEKPPKLLPSSSENGFCAEVSLISHVVSSRNQNTCTEYTGQTVEVSSQAFACSQCPFIDTEKVNLHQHIEKVHPEELSRTLQQMHRAGAEETHSYARMANRSEQC
ncbi:hypothetical protein COCON_G00099290 [Conger conger]|uniref:C2H2-type domain-containing protein n=1 Tax=Conger conger TaxID=82655 RepID=A0A9Q1DMT4_CONCO|nr:hypothetical protein COCON_G00099290 [Conger conger]